MQPQLCSRCKKNAAVVFITKIEGSETKNEGLCLKCARELHIKPVDDMMEKMGISDEDLDAITSEMAGMLGGLENMADLMAPEDDDGESTDDGKTTTFPFMNRLFGGGETPPAGPGPESSGERPGNQRKEKNKKGKFLDNYCISLTGRAREGKLDNMIGRKEELERVIQILNRRQKNNPCLIGEPGVGKTAIAEGLALAIAKGDVPDKLRDK